MKIVAIFLLGAVLFLPEMSSAETLTGSVVSVDSSANKVIISTASDTGAAENAILAIAPETKLRGCSLAKLKEGDRVSAMITEQNPEGIWQTTSIKKITALTRTKCH